MYDPIGLCVEESECSVVAEELPPGIALGQCEKTRGAVDGLPMACRWLLLCSYSPFTLGDMAAPAASGVVEMEFDLAL